MMEPKFITLMNLPLEQIQQLADHQQMGPCPCCSREPFPGYHSEIVQQEVAEEHLPPFLRALGINMTTIDMVPCGKCEATGLVPAFCRN